MSAPDIDLRARVGEMVSRAENALLTAADGVRITVGAAALATDGTWGSGVNIFHFTGSVCAELVAVAQLLTLTTAPPMVVAAVGDANRGVMPPCGRCRQLFSDYWPDIAFVVPSEGGLAVAALQDLLPKPYVSRPRVVEPREEHDQ